jgi:PAS domain S-box-containing protein
MHRPIEFFSRAEVLKSLLIKVPGHIYWKDREGRLMGCNQNLANFFNFKSVDEIVGKTSFDLGKSAEEAQEILRKDLLVVSEKTIKDEEEVFTLSDGSKRVYLTRREPLFDDEGNVMGLMGISTDITEQKLREKLEIDNQALNKANDMMRFWAGAIAHEIRTPLMSIALMGDSLDFFISTLIHDYPDLWKDSPRKATSLQYIQKLPKNFAEITKSMNHFVDMALMKVSPEKSKKYELKPMQIKENVQMVIDAYPFKKIDDDKNERDLVHINILDNFTFNGDETLFRHLIYNLMKNAIYFVRKANKGEIFIEAIAGKSTDQNPNPMNYLYFKDTGPGIPEENLQHLFKAFFSRSQNGTGVGLSLCKSIMNEFGGNISCESVEGEFTKFVMEFPKG